MTTHTPAAPPAPPPAAPPDPRLPALLAWRRRLLDAGTVPAAVFKETHLRMVLRSGHTEPAQLAALLPDPVAAHAVDLAALLAELPGPAPQPAVAGPGPVPVPETKAAHDLEPHPGPDRDPAPEAFAPYRVTAPTGPAPRTVTLRRDRDTVTLSWPAHDAPHAVYRVVSADDHPPHNPDRAHTVAATTERSARDDTPPAAAVRHYQVWVHAGATRADALAAAPVLHAAAPLVAPVTAMTVTEDSGRVIGQWSTFPGVRAVHVYRLPAERATGPGAQHRILADHTNLHGVVDTGARRGARYLYRARCEVLVDGVARLSAITETPITVSAVLAPVADLTLTMHQRDPVSVDLTWTAPPAGRVVVYRTEAGPAAGAAGAELPESALDQAGLHPRLALTHPVTAGRGPDGAPQAVMADVPWPAGWSRAYFTPVTILHGRARLGASTSAVRTGVIDDVALTEYCAKQVLTFGWPRGAAAVAVHLGPVGRDPRHGLSGRRYEVTAEDYERDGGMVFSGQLPLGGCALHLAPVAFSGGRRMLGALTSIDYPGLLRVWYTVQISRDDAGAPLAATVAVRAEADAAGSPPFVLVHHPDRIPLSATDGAPVDVAPLRPDGRLAAAPTTQLRFAALGTAGSEPWAADLRGRTGWIRLFAQLPADRLTRLALLDPPVPTLRLTGAQR